MKISNKLKAAMGLLAFLAVLIPAKSAMSKDPSPDAVVLSADNTIVLDDEMAGEVIANVILKAKELDNALDTRVNRALGNKKPLYLFLNSPGGSVQAGLEMFEALDGLGRPVHTVTLFAASMAFQTAQNLGDRLILKNGVLMSHRARGGFTGEFGGQSPSQMESRQALWLSRITELDKKTVERTKGKQTLESYQKQYASEMWLTGAQSVEQGYADRVVTIKCDSSLAGVNTKEVSFFGLVIQYDVDKCPINTGPMNIRIGLRTNHGIKPLNTFKEENGGFGSDCIQMASMPSSNKLCALDTSLNIERIDVLKNQFIDTVVNKRNHIVDKF